MRDSELSDVFIRDYIVHLGVATSQMQLKD